MQNEAAEVFKVWKNTNDVFKVINVLEFNNLRTDITLFLCFGKKIFDRMMKTHVEF